jgi:hypothetical protein
MAAGPEQQVKKDHAADDADDDADRDFIGRANNAAQNIAGEHEAGAHHGHPGDGAAHVVANHEADEVGDDEAKEGDGADRHEHDSADQRNDDQAQHHDALIVEA